MPFSLLQGDLCASIAYARPEAILSVHPRERLLTLPRFDVSAADDHLAVAAQRDAGLATAQYDLVAKRVHAWSSPTVAPSSLVARLERHSLAIGQHIACLGGLRGGHGERLLPRWLAEQPDDDRKVRGFVLEDDKRFAPTRRSVVHRRAIERHGRTRLPRGRVWGRAAVAR